jgi:hypothetical protein
LPALKRPPTLVVLFLRRDMSRPGRRPRRARLRLLGSLSEMFDDHLGSLNARPPLEA